MQLEIQAKFETINMGKQGLEIGSRQHSVAQSTLMLTIVMPVST
jgi:hypothetical protein